MVSIKCDVCGMVYTLANKKDVDALHKERPIIFYDFHTAVLQAVDFSYDADLAVYMCQTCKCEMASEIEIIKRKFAEKKTVACNG